MHIAKWITQILCSPSFNVSVSDLRLTVVLLKFPPPFFFFFTPLKLRKLVSTSGRYQVN